MLRVSKFLSSTCKVVQNGETRVMTLVYTNYNAGHNVTVLTLRQETDWDSSTIQDRVFCRIHQTFYYVLRFSHLISDTNEETANTVSCVGAASLGSNWYSSSWITGTVLTSIAFVYQLINTIIHVSVCIIDGQLKSLRERQRILYWHIFNVYDLFTVSLMLPWPDWQMVKMVLSNILYFYRNK